MWPLWSPLFIPRHQCNKADLWLVEWMRLKFFQVNFWYFNWERENWRIISINGSAEYFTKFQPDFCELLVKWAFNNKISLIIPAEIYYWLVIVISCWMHNFLLHEPHKIPVLKAQDYSKRVSDKFRHWFILTQLQCTPKNIGVIKGCEKFCRKMQQISNWWNSVKKYL